MSAEKSNMTENLRLRAEDLLTQATENFLPADIADINKLHHELAVHQAELELQNEELQDTQLSLRKVRDRYVELYENAPVGYVLLDASGIIRRTNSTWRAMLGRPDDEFCGTPFAEILLEDDARVFLSRFRSFFHNPAEKQIELRIKRHQSEPCHAQITAKRRFDEHEKNESNELMVIVSDITERKLAEEMLREQRDFSDRLIETAQSIILVLDNQGRIVQFNSYMEKLVGYELDEVKGQDWFETFIKPDNSYTLKSLFQKAVDDSSTRGNVNPIIAKDGRTIFVEWYDKALKDKDGLTVGVLAIGQDITERKQVETYREMGREILQIFNETDDLQESIQRVLAALKTRTGADAVGLRLQEGEDFPYFAQDGFPTDFLLSENTLVERAKDGGVCRDKDGNICLECTCGLVISGQTDPANPLFTTGGSCWTNDSFPLLDLPSTQDPRMHPRNNCMHHGYASLALIPIRTRDRIVGLIQLNDKRKGRFSLETIEILESIAAHVGSALMRKQAEDQIKKNYEVLLETQALGNIGSWGLDFVEEKISWSPENYRIFGYPENTTPSFELFFERIHPDDREKVIQHFDKAKKTGVFDIEYRLVIDHQTKWVQGKGNFEYKNNEPVRVLGFTQDITEKKNYQQAQLRSGQLSALGEVASGVAHEINNPINGVINYAQLLINRNSENDQANQILERIIREGNRISAIVKNLLNFAKKDRSKLSSLDIAEIVTEPLNLQAQLLKKDGINIDLRVPSDLPKIYGNRMQLEQVVLNLLSNARHALHKKYPQPCSEKCIVIEAASSHDKNGGCVQLTIKDFGCGIPNDHLEKIFNPFFTTKEAGIGTGLGLSVSHEILEKHNATISVESEVGKFTNITMTFPANSQ